MVFDYESGDSNFTIPVRVSDEHNFSIEKTFFITLLNVVEDTDGDGVPDYLDSDNS